MTQQSAIVETLIELARLGAAERGIGELTELELAAIGATWGLWERPNQAIPPAVELGEAQGMHDKYPWPLWGRTRPGKRWRVGACIGPRGSGKSAAIRKHVHKMAMTMEWPLFLLLAQGQDEAIEIFVEAEDGLVNGAPAWEQPYYTAGTGGKGGRLVWPSGAVGVIGSGGAKAKRGQHYYGAYLEEVTDWPNSKRVAAWASVIASVRAGSGHILMATTPSTGHPVIEEIKRRAETDETYWWIRYGKQDNQLFVIPGYIEDLAATTAGTHLYAEEVEGIEGEQRGLVKTADIEAARRELASVFERRIVVLDPTGADPKTSDKVDVVGLMGWGLCKDQQLMPLKDRTGHKGPELYAAEAVEMYIAGRCDCLVIETDRGGVLPTSLVRAAARDIAPTPGEDPERTRQMAELRRLLNGTAWQVLAVKPDFRTRYQHGTIYVREVRTWADKPTRASLLAQLYHQHRVSHPYGIDLDSYERTITTHEFRPNAQSPGDFDCGSWAAVELLGKYQDLKMGQGKGQHLLNEAARAKEPLRRSHVSRPLPATTGGGRSPYTI
jgi:phage terminase large subunit-like protein